MLKCAVHTPNYILLQHDDSLLENVFGLIDKLIVPFVLIAIWLV